MINNKKIYKRQKFLINYKSLINNNLIMKNK